MEHRHRLACCFVPTTIQRFEPPTRCGSHEITSKSEALSTNISDFLIDLNVYDYKIDATTNTSGLTFSQYFHLPRISENSVWKWCHTLWPWLPTRAGIYRGTLRASPNSSKFFPTALVHLEVPGTRGRKLTWQGVDAELNHPSTVCSWFTHQT